MANENKKDTVEVPKAEIEELKKSVSAMAGTIKDQAAQIDRITAAAMTGGGLDPAISVRNELKHVLVQFNAEYNRSAVVSEVQKGAAVFPGYHVRAGEIVLLKEDEVDRLVKDRPGLVIVDDKKFEPMKVIRYERQINKNTGRIEPKKTTETISVEKLVEDAVEKG